MKIAEAHIPEKIIGNMSIHYKAGLDISAKNIFDDVPLDVLLALSDYEEDELEAILIKLILAMRIGKDRVLRAGESMLVQGHVVIKE